MIDCAHREVGVASRISLKLRQALGIAAKQLSSIKESSAYHWVSLGDIFGVEGEVKSQQVAV